jgi:hypothetical protein
LNLLKSGGSMRGMFLVMAVAVNGFSLTTQDLVGMWKAEGLEGDGSIEELWYAADGNREVRSTAIYNDLEYRLDALGTWQVKTESVVEKITGGWISYDGSLDPIQPDAASNSSKAVIVAGSPRKLQITDCDSPSLCVTHEYTFVSAEQQFNQPALGGTTSARGTSRIRPVRLRGAGRSGFRFLLGGREFDVTGRLLGAGFR